jgi:hypothetical protein
MPGRTFAKYAEKRLRAPNLPLAFLYDVVTMVWRTKCFAAVRSQGCVSLTKLKE